MSTIVANLHLFISFINLSKFTILDPMIISFSFPASCGLFRNLSCPFVFYWKFNRSRCSEDFPLELLIQNNLVPLELFSDRFGNSIFVFSLLKATVQSEAEEENRYRRPWLFSTGTPMLSRAALRVCRVGNLLACILESILRAVKKTLPSLLN